MSVGAEALDVRRRKAAAGLAVGALVAAAWLALAVWGASPYGRYLDHDGLLGSGLGDAALLGRFCVGCCWALMLLMFALGLGSLGWMLLLGAVMALEKNALWGTDLTVSLGGALLVAAAALVVSGVA